MTRSEPSHGTRVRGARAAIVALLLVALLVLTISRASHPTTAAAAPATAAHAVSPREFVHVIRLTGLTEAVTSYTGRRAGALRIHTRFLDDRPPGASGYGCQKGRRARGIRSPGSGEDGV